MRLASKDIPLSEITLRKYERPSSSDRRELIKKLCLSIGLLNPGDSRDVVVDILSTLMEAKKKKRWMRAEDIRDSLINKRKVKNSPNSGCALSNIRRQLLRLRNIGLVEKSKNKYRIVEFGVLPEIFEEKTLRYIVEPALERIKEHLSAVENAYCLTRKQKL
ncbi:MAG: hypothetical protein QXJ50_03165 [Candidatus Woesearchaeota archaeon]